MNLPPPTLSFWVTAMTVLVGCAVLCVLVYPLFTPRSAWDAGSAGLLARLKKRRERLLRALKDADFERQTGALAEEEHRALRNDLKAKAIRVTRDLERARVARLRTLMSRSGGLPPSQRKRLDDLVAKRLAALTAARTPKGADS